MKLKSVKDFRTGMKVKCEIKGVVINDAKLLRGDDNYWYVCQNQMSGRVYKDSLGYDFTWAVTNHWVDGRDGIFSIESIDFTIDDLKLGDEIIGLSPSTKRTVQATVGNVVFYTNEKDSNATYFKIFDVLDKEGSFDNLKAPATSSTPEYTMEELIKLVGHDLKVKK